MKLSSFVNILLMFLVWPLKNPRIYRLLDNFFSVDFLPDTSEILTFLIREDIELKPKIQDAKTFICGQKGIKTHQKAIIKELLQLVQPKMLPSLSLDKDSIDSLRDIAKTSKSPEAKKLLRMCGGESFKAAGGRGVVAARSDVKITKDMNQRELLNSAKIKDLFKTDADIFVDVSLETKDKQTLSLNSKTGVVSFQDSQKNMDSITLISHSSSKKSDEQPCIGGQEIVAVMNTVGEVKGDGLVMDLKLGLNNDKRTRSWQRGDKDINEAKCDYHAKKGSKDDVWVTTNRGKQGLEKEWLENNTTQSSIETDFKNLMKKAGIYTPEDKSTFIDSARKNLKKQLGVFTKCKTEGRKFVPIAISTLIAVNRDGTCASKLIDPDNCLVGEDVDTFLQEYRKESKFGSIDEDLQVRADGKVTINKFLDKATMGLETVIRALEAVASDSTSTHSRSTNTQEDAFFRDQIGL